MGVRLKIIYTLSILTTDRCTDARYSMTAALQPLLDDLRAALQALYGDRLARLVLYGSHARDEAHDESDVDVMVVLAGAVRPVQEIRRMSGICLTLGMRYERRISVFPVSADAFANKDSMLLRQVHAEGVTV